MRAVVGESEFLCTTKAYNGQGFRMSIFKLFTKYIKFFFFESSNEKGQNVENFENVDLTLR